MRKGAAATTSQPSPAALLAAYESAAADGATGVLSLHLDRRVSGVAASAEIAARDAPIPVVVVDPPTVSYGVALCVRAAHGALAEGATSCQAAVKATHVATALGNAFVVRAAPGGRVPAAADAWTLLRFAHGEAQILSRHDLPDAATTAMVHAIAGSGARSVAVGHAGREVEASADALAHELLAEEHVGTVERYRVTPSVGAHTGPDAYGAFWWPVGD